MPAFPRPFPSLLPIAALSLAIGACTVGPDHVRPELPVAERFARDVGTGDAIATPVADAAFWREFGDPQLDALVESALSANHDLRIALARLDRANAISRSAKLDRLPTSLANADARERRAGSDEMPGADRAARDTESYSVDASVSWELDLFGRIRRNVEAGLADARAGEADLAATQVAIVAEVARTYFELRGLQERLRVARANADNQAETLRLVQARFDAGRDSEFDLSRARAQQATTSSRIPALESQAASAMHRLAVLTGRTPDALVARLSEPAPLPALPARIDPGTPGDLLRRRPDVAAAEARLRAATARIGVATADLFPRFTLGGLIGSASVDTGALFERDSETRLVALGIDWAFLDIGRVRARIAAADADAAGALAGYERSVLLALEDAENALVRHARAREEDALLQRAAHDSAKAARLARTRFEAGATDLLDVLDAERTRLQAEDAFADARTRSATSAVVLFKALAGGWPDSPPVRVEVGQR
jgi:NodT family efflux transporter outer membrane factor (OMF) lipoprotein